MKRLLQGVCACWLALAAAAQAQQALDSPFVGTPPVVADAMLRMAGVGRDDYVIDLGCGDGRLIIAAAAKFGARGYGVDLDGALVSEARREARRHGVQDRTQFEVRNLYDTDIAQATVLTLFLYQRVNLELRPRILSELKPGTRVVTHEFDFGNWRPDEQRTVEVPNKPYGPPRSTVYLWIVPADASGRWVWHVPQRAQAYEVTLQQTFQQVTPVAPPNADDRVEEARLRGDRISFVLVSGGRRERYDGRINGDTISGTVTAGAETRPWAATRTERGRMDIEAGPSRPQNYAKESR